MRMPATPAASSGRLWPAVLVATMTTSVVGWVFKAHCVFDGAWDGGEQYTVGCYTDVVPFWSIRGVADGLVPYVQTPLEYPVLAGLQIYVEGTVARLFGGSAAAFLAWVSLVNAVCAVAVVVLLARIGVPRRRLWWWALAPALVLYVGHNWDLVPVVAVLAAIDLHRRHRPTWAGVAVGLGTAAKLFPGLLLPLLALSYLRGGRVRAAVRVVAGAAVAWLAVNLPVAVAAPQAWLEFYTFSSERIGTFAATWTVLDELGLLTSGLEQRNLWATAAFAVGAVAIVAFGWRRAVGHEWVLLTPVVAWFLLTNKVYSPQFDLWVVALLVLTSRRWWPLAAFALVDIGVYWAEFWYLARLADFTPSGSYGALAVAASARAVVLLAIIVLALTELLPSWIVAGDDDDAVDAGVVRAEGALAAANVVDRGADSR